MSDDGLLPFIAPYLATKVHRAMLRPWHPHKLLTMRPEPLAHRLTRVRTLWQQSTISNRTFYETFIGDICGCAMTRGPDDAAFGPLIEFVCDLYIQNSLYLATFAPFDLSRSLTAIEAALIEDRLLELETLCTYTDKIQGAFHDCACEILRHLDDVIPRGPLNGSLQAPLHALLESTPTYVQRWLVTFLTELPRQRDAVTCMAVSETANQLWQNLCAVSGLTPEEAVAHPNRIEAPERCGLAPDAIITTYLHDTPLAKLLNTPIPFSIPRRAFNEHGAIFAKSGHGKTQTLRALIASFLQEDDPPALFIIDSLGSLLDGIADLEIFENHLRDRLVVLDPSRPETLPALDFFNLQSDDLCFYLFKAIDQSFTPRQATMISYLMELLRNVPGANFLTLIQVCEAQRNPYPEATAELSPFARSFFDNQFFVKKPDTLVQQTKSQIAARIYNLGRLPKFNDMFSGRGRVPFDPFACMQQKKIVLIHTDASPPRLGGLGEASAIFGRFVLAQCLDAARARPKDQRHLALLVVDEAKAYMDQQAAMILSDARQFGLGMVLSTQFPHQLDDGVRREINTNTSIRLMGPVEYSVASQYARDMFTTPEFIMGMKAFDKSHAEWATYVANLTDHAVKLDVPYGAIERMPKRRARPTRIGEHVGPTIQPDPAVTNATTAPPGSMAQAESSESSTLRVVTAPPEPAAKPKAAPRADDGAADPLNDDESFSAPMKGA